MIPGSFPVDGYPEAALELPEAYQPLFEDWRYTVFWGGRDSAKSHSIARALVSEAHSSTVRILCTREYQASIKDSVHRLLQDVIASLGLTAWFDITDRSIRHILTKSEFIFKGLHNNYAEIKSTEGIDRCWVEEAQKVSHDSWVVLIHTIRKPGSRIIISFNPLEETDATYVRFVPRCETCRKAFEDNELAEEHHRKLPEHVVKLPPPRSRVIKTSWRDNPWTSAEMEAEREYLRKVDPDGYAQVYEGECTVLSDAIIFKGKYYIHEWTTPNDPAPVFRHGADFGYGPAAPATLMRCYITDEPAMQHPDGSGKWLPAGKHLWIDHEAYGWGVEQDDLPNLYNSIETASGGWPIKGDASRPETISHVKSKGFSISAATKWQGSIEDGIFWLKQFVLIHVHERCKNFQIECRMYRYKVDRNQIDPKTNSPVVLPIIIDAWNHGWDAIRYAFDGMITSRAKGSWGQGWLT